MKPGKKYGGSVVRSERHPVNDLNEVGGGYQKCKHQPKIILITSDQLKDPTQTFEISLKNVAFKEVLQKNFFWLISHKKSFNWTANSYHHFKKV